MSASKPETLEYRQTMSEACPLPGEIHASAEPTESLAHDKQIRGTIGGVQVDTEDKPKSGQESPDFNIQISNYEKQLQAKAYRFHEPSTIQEQFTEELLQASYTAVPHASRLDPTLDKILLYQDLIDANIVDQ